MKKETITMKLTPVYIVCFILFLPSLLSGDPQYVFLSDYYNSGHTISRCNLDGSGYMRLLPYDTSQYTGYVGEIAVDNESQMVYWNSWSEIRRCSFDGSNLETVPIPTEYWLGGIAIGGDKLYWTQDSVIKSANLDGSNSQDLVTGLGKCFSLAFDNVYDKLYYIGYEDKTWEKGHIYSADPDGSNIEQLVSNLDLAVGLAVDPYNEKLYWTSRSSSYNSIKSANLDGTGITDLITSQQNPLVSVVQHIDIDWLGNKLYWTDQSGGGKTQRMNPDGTGYEVIHYGNAPYGIAVSIPEAMVINVPPVACVVGGDRVVEAEEDCEVRVVLDGSCSSDADSTEGTNDDINDFDWYEVIDACDPNSDVFLGSGEVIECNLPLGEHDIILEVTDKACAFDANEVTINVEDTTPPGFSLTVEPDVLWPANHKMVEITPSWEVSDNCDELPEVTLVDITMNEDGATEDDIQVKGDGSIYLRAERSGKGIGRIYTITYQAVDDSGNVSIGSADVTVPHNKRKSK
ncbi:MAG: TolB family protein [Planctomycetota bacterium]